MTFKALCRAFQVHPTALYQLEARGTLPERPPRQPIPPEYIRALAEHRRKAGALPPAAAELLAGLEAGQ